MLTSKTIPEESEKMFNQRQLECVDTNRSLDSQVAHKDFLYTLNNHRQYSKLASDELNYKLNETRDKNDGDSNRNFHLVRMTKSLATARLRHYAESTNNTTNNKSEDEHQLSSHNKTNICAIDDENDYENRNHYNNNEYDDINDNSNAVLTRRIPNSSSTDNNSNEETEYNNSHLNESFMMSLNRGSMFFNELNDDCMSGKELNDLNCGFCSTKNVKKTFKNKNDLRNHIYKDHIDLFTNKSLTNFKPNQTNNQQQQQQQQVNQLNQSKQAMDSFCAICQKELCNKYFLKSHLINKHGIQLEDYLNYLSSSAQFTTPRLPLSASNKIKQESSSSRANSASSPLSSITSLNAPSPLSHKSNQANLNLSKTLMALCANNGNLQTKFDQDLLNSFLMTHTEGYMNGVNYTNTQEDEPELVDELEDQMYENDQPEYDEQMLIANSLQMSKQIDSSLFTHYLNLAFQKQHQQKGATNLTIDLLNEHLKTTNTPLTNKQLVNQLTNVTNGSGILSSHATSSQTTNSDFCDLCQKQFCNKYYLKKHKQDVHGVLTTSNQTTSLTPSTTFTENIKKKSNDNATQALLNSLSMTANNNALTLSNSYLNSNMMQMSNNNSSLTTNPSSVSSASSVYSEISSNLKHVEKQINAQSDAVPNLIEFQEKIANELKLPMATLTKSATSSSSISNIGSTGRAILNKVPISSMNEVKCDQCAKVFFNQEFLTLHKLNKHAQQTKPITNESSQPQTKHQQQHQHEKKDDSTVANQLNCQGNANNNAKKASDAPNILYNESFCEYCNKSFCNKYFLRTHMNKAHGKTLIIENNMNNINTLLSHEEAIENEDGLNLNETYFASKVVDRVVCDICNKQVCNKYFLRTHKQKVHGIYESTANSNQQNLNGNPNMMPGTITARTIATTNAHMEEDDYDDNNDREDEMYVESELDEEFANETNRAETELGEIGHTHRPMRRDSESSSNSISSDEFSHTNTQQQEQQSQQIKQQNISLSKSQSSHMIYKPNRSSYCDLCQRQFYSRSFLINHMRKIHGINLNEIMDEHEQRKFETHFQNWSSNTNGELVNGESEDDGMGDNEIGECVQEAQFESQNENVINVSDELNNMSTERNEYGLKNESNEEELGESFESNQYAEHLNESFSDTNQQAQQQQPLQRAKISTNSLFKNKIFSHQNSNNPSKSSERQSNYNSYMRAYHQHYRNVNRNFFRVNCHICNKELCNKYFLKQHVLNSHDMSFNDYCDKFNSKIIRKPASKFKHKLIMRNKKLLQSIRDRKESLLLDENALSSMKNNINSNVENKNVADNIMAATLVTSTASASVNKRKRQNSGNSSIDSYSTASPMSSLSNQNQQTVRTGTISTEAIQVERSRSPNSCSSSLSCLSSSMSFNKYNKHFNEPSLDLDACQREHMQAFLIETEHEQENGELINLPCLVHLPVKRKIENSISLSIRLKPINQQQVERREPEEGDDEYHEVHTERIKMSPSKAVLMVEESKQVI